MRKPPIPPVLEGSVSEQAKLLEDWQWKLTSFCDDIKREREGNKSYNSDLLGVLEDAYDVFNSFSCSDETETEYGESWYIYSNLQQMLSSEYSWIGQHDKAVFLARHMSDCDPINAHRIEHLIDMLVQARRIAEAVIVINEIDIHVLRGEADSTAKIILQWCFDIPEIAVGISPAMLKECVTLVAIHCPCDLVSRDRKPAVTF